MVNFVIFLRTYFSYSDISTFRVPDQSQRWLKAMKSKAMAASFSQQDGDEGDDYSSQEILSGGADYRSSLPPRPPHHRHSNNSSKCSDNGEWQPLVDVNGDNSQPRPLQLQ